MSRPRTERGRSERPIALAFPASTPHGSEQAGSHRRGLHSALLFGLLALLAAARARARERGLDVVLTGLASAGAPAALVRGLRRAREYRSMLYVVRWPEDPAPALDGRPVAPELALL